MTTEEKKIEDQSTISVSVGTFVFNNKLKIGAESDIAVRRSTITNGLYGQMIVSPDVSEMMAAWRINRMCELDGRLIKAPSDDWKGFKELTKEELDEVWRAWTEKSGLFRSQPDKPSDGSEGSESGENGS